MFTNSLKAKLLMLCMGLSLVSVSVGAIGYLSLNKLSSSYEKVSTTVLNNVEQSKDMYLDFVRVRVLLRTLGLSALSKDQSKEVIEQIKATITSYEEINKKYVDKGFIEGEETLYKKVDSSWKEFKSVGNTLLNLYDQDSVESKEKMMKIFFSECPSLATVYTKSINDLVSFHEHKGELWTKEAQNEKNFTNHLLLGVTICGGLLGLICGAIMASKLSKSIQTVSSSLESGAKNVDQASTLIAKNSQSLSASTSEQATSLEETVSSMEELTSIVKVNTDNAKQASMLALTTREIALKGDKEVKSLIESISKISSDSKKIKDIIGVIDDIAFQTNLLALNASIEAARAGESGRGFSVVADAVRSLAQKSAESAKNISQLISESVEKIEQSTNQAESSEKVFVEIVSSVKKMADLNSEISSASEEQFKGISQINKAMNTLDETTQLNATYTKDSESSASELLMQSTNLKNNVNALKMIVDGKVNKTVENIEPIKSNVVKIPTKKKSISKEKNIAENVIPFDEDLERKVGNTEGF